MQSVESLIGLLLGSNISPAVNLLAAYYELSQRFQIVRSSQVWESPAVGKAGPDFLNMALLIRSRLEPFELKYGVFRPIESGLGRVRSRDKFAPRTIDIDVVTQADRTLDPELWEQAHVTVPVSEILPGLISPATGERLDAAADRLLKQAEIRLHRENIFWPGNPSFSRLQGKPVRLGSQA